MEENIQTPMGEEVKNQMQNGEAAKKTPKPLTFGKTMLASALGFVVVIAIANILAFIMMISLIVSLSSMSKDTKATVKEDSFVKLDLTAMISERKPNELLALMSEEKMVGLDQLLAAIDEASKDDHVNGIYVYMGSGSAVSWGVAEELRSALQRFQESGKAVLAYADTYSQTGYYIASMADTVMLNPSGFVDFRGIGAEALFYKDLLDKLDVKMQLIRPRNNAYKSAGETYTMNHMSEANREQIRAYVGSIWNYVAANMAQSRGLSIEKVNKIADDLNGYLAADAKANGLVDVMGFEADMKTIMKECYDGRHTIAAARYAENFGDKDRKEKIAIVYAEGNVVPGKGNGYQTAVYGDDVAKAIEKAAKDDNVKAIVLRVNSPGGAVTASEIMTDAVVKAKAKKPVVVSMSDLAASAGYEISSNATYIVAQPTTITGSIGVFATIPEVGNMLKHKLGITTDTVMTNRNSAALSVMRPLSPTAMEMLQRNVEQFYDTFCLRVATGRNLTVDYVDSIARGRCWTGVDAQRLGLVDTLGGLNLARAIAAEKAGLKNYSIVKYPEEKSWQSMLLKLGDEESRAALRRQLKMRSGDPMESLYEQLEALVYGEPLQARLPYVINLTR